MGTYAPVDIIYPDPVLPGKDPAFMLVLSIFLIRTGRIAVKGKIGAGWIVNWQIMVHKIPDHISPSKITCHAGINEQVNNLVRNDTFPVTVIYKYLFQHCQS